MLTENHVSAVTTANMSGLSGAGTPGNGIMPPMTPVMTDISSYPYIDARCIDYTKNAYMSYSYFYFSGLVQTNGMWQYVFMTNPAVFPHEIGHLIEVPMADLIKVLFKGDYGLVANDPHNNVREIRSVIIQAYVEEYYYGIPIANNHKCDGLLTVLQNFLKRDDICLPDRFVEDEFAKWTKESVMAEMHKRLKMLSDELVIMNENYK